MKTKINNFLMFSLFLLAGTFMVKADTPAAPTFTWDKSELTTAWTATTGPSLVKEVGGIKLQQIGTVGTLSAYMNISSANGTALAPLALNSTASAAITITSASDYISSIVVFYASSGGTRNVNPYMGYNATPTEIGSSTIPVPISSCETAPIYAGTTASSYAFTPPAGTKFAILVAGATCKDIVTNTGQNRISHIDVYTTPSVPAIMSFTAAGVNATIDQTAKTIKAILPYGTNLSSITPVVTIGGTATSYSPAGAKDFSKGTVTYTATDGTVSTNYAVSLTAVTSASSDATLKDLKVDGVSVTGFSPDLLAYNITLPFIYSGMPTVTATVNDITATLSITQVSAIPGIAQLVVKAQNNSVQVYQVAFSRIPPSTLCEMSSFKLNGRSGVFSGQNILARIQYTDVTSLTPTIVVSPLATYTPVGPQNFTNPVTYVVSAEDGSQKTYIVTVEQADLKYSGPYPYETNFPSEYVLPEWITSPTGGVSFVNPYGAGTSGADKVLWYDNETETTAATASVLRALTGATIEFYVSNCTNFTAELSATGNRTFQLFVDDVLTTSLPVTAANTKVTLTYAVNKTVPTTIGVNCVEGTAFTMGHLKIEGLGTGLKDIKIEGVRFNGTVIHNDNNLNLMVFDAMGRLVQNSKEDINMKMYPKGLYFIKSNLSTLKIVLTK